MNSINPQIKKKIHIPKLVEKILSAKDNWLYPREEKCISIKLTIQWRIDFSTCIKHLVHIHFKSMKENKSQTKKIDKE